MTDIKSRKGYAEAHRRALAKLGFYAHLLLYLVICTLLVVIDFTTGEGVLVVFPITGWSIVLCSHWMSVYMDFAFVNRMVAREQATLLKQSGATEPSEALQVQAQNCARSKLGFYLHVALYLLMVGFLFFVNRATSSSYWFFWPALAWCLALATHWYSTFTDQDILQRMTIRELKMLPRADGE